MGFVDTKIEEVCVRELDRFGYVTSSNHKIIESGVKRVIHLIEDFSLVLVVGFLMKSVVAGIIMEIVYFPLRIYAGGYHASREAVCKILTYRSIVIGLGIISYVYIPKNLLHFSTVLGCLLIYMLAPVDNDKKRLGKLETEKFRKRSRLIVIAVFILYLILNVLCAQKCMKAITYDVVVISVGLIVQKRNKKE